MEHAPPIFSLLYGSTSALDDAERDAAIDRIVSVSQVWNADHAITGVLIYAQGRFSQLLEGGERDVRALMARIAADPRHSDVGIALEETRAERRVPGWSLVYAGPSSFVDGHITALGNPGAAGGIRAAAARLIDLMVEFSRNDFSRITAY